MGYVMRAWNTGKCAAVWVGLVLAVWMVAAPAMAQAVPAVGGTTPSVSGGGASEVCTNFAERKQEVFGGGGPTRTVGGTGGGESTGILSDIYNFIKGIVGSATQNLFEAFTQDSRYQNALAAVFTLSVVFFGVAFTMGLMQISYGQVLMRLVKMGIVMTLISPAGWDYFNTTVVHFFNDGTDDLVKTVVSIGTGVATPPDATPFYQFDKMAEYLINPEIIVLLLGVLTSGPYGLAMAGFTIISLIGFIKLLIDALRIYAVTYVARCMLLGMAPVFLAFLLFDRTKQLFQSWVNAILSMALQPILMFTFLSFFIVLLETASQDMLSTDFCWTDVKTLQGTVNNIQAPRAKGPDGQPVRGDYNWQGAAQCLLAQGGVGGAQCPESPLNIINIFTFLILVYLANRFSGMIDQIANELSASYISLDTGGKIGQALKEQAGGISSWIPGGGNREPSGR